MAFDSGVWTASLLALAPDAKRVTIGALATWGVLDDDEQLADDGTGQPVTVRTRHVTIAAGSLTGLVDGATVSVGGVSYTVRGRPMPRENGELWQVRVTKVDT